MNYKSLFKSPPKNKDDKTINTDQLDSKWSWHSIIHTMCKEFNYVGEEVWKLNYITVLNYIGYIYEKNKIEENIFNKKQRKY